MAGINNLLSLARDALSAQSAGINVTGQNIANVNTPGYARREVVLSTKVAGTVTYGGVDATQLRRVYDQFLDARSFESGSLSAAAQGRDQALSSVEGLFNDAGGTGLVDSMSAMFSSFSALTANPQDTTARADVLAKADAFASTVRDTSQKLSDIKSDLFSQAQGTTTEINRVTSQIADLNKQIGLVTAQGGDASDLRDQRDALTTTLSGDIDVKVVQDSGGKYVIFSAETALVEGDRAGTLSATLASDGTMQLSMQRSGGASMDLTGRLSGGKLAGIAQARDGDIAQISAKLDQLAFDVGTQVNAQHAAGVGLDGFAGRALFNVSASPAGAAATFSLDPAMVGHPELVAAASAANPGPGGSDNAAALAALSQSSFASGGTRTAVQAYSDLVGEVGQRKAQAAQDVQVRGAIADQTKSMRDSVSGVSLDEEMVNLSKYQRAYEAASKLLQTTDELLATLIQQG